MPIIRKEYYGDSEAIRGDHALAFKQPNEADLAEHPLTAGQAVRGLVAENNRKVAGQALSPRSP